MRRSPSLLLETRTPSCETESAVIPAECADRANRCSPVKMWKTLTALSREPAHTKGPKGRKQTAVTALLKACCNIRVHVGICENKTGEGGGEREKGTQVDGQTKTDRHPDHEGCGLAQQVCTPASHPTYERGRQRVGGERWAASDDEDACRAGCTWRRLRSSPVSACQRQRVLSELPVAIHVQSEWKATAFTRKRCPLSSR